MHAVAVLELMSDERAILAAGSGDNDIKRTVMTAVAIAELFEFAAAFFPIDDVIFFIRPLTRVADALIVKFRPRPLVGHDTVAAELDFFRKFW
jgi:hypothetical protein